MILHPKAKDPTHEKHRQIRIEGLSTKYLTSANTTQNNCEKQKKHKQLSQQRGAWEHDGKMCGVLGQEKGFGVKTKEIGIKYGLYTIIYSYWFTNYAKCA